MHELESDGILSDRRGFLAKAGVACGVFGVTAAAARAEEEEEGEEEISPAEDLMREHGVLKRILLIYDEGVRRLDEKEDLNPAHLHDAASIVRSFIEDYHEKLEEDFLFPRFRKANTLADLVDVLEQQHQAGRRLTEDIIGLTATSDLRPAEDRNHLVEWLHAFNRMYSPHEAREDTVLFPTLREIVSANEYDALGEDFEKKEHTLFGDDGFEAMVDRVADIEKALGIYDLRQFTPNV